MDQPRSDMVGRLFVACVMAGLAACAAACAEDAAYGRGQRWVRSHPFTLTALTMSPSGFDADAYEASGMNVMLAWKFRPLLFEAAAAIDMPWIANVSQLKGGMSLPELQEQIGQLAATHPGNVGWLVWDEPNLQQMPKAAPLMQWLRETYPDSLVFSNGYPLGAKMREYYGQEAPDAGYSYEQYLRDMVRIMDTDVLMYDAYIFKEDGSTSNLFPTMGTARKVALEAGIPYWAFVQSHQDIRRKYRMPSESDVRMHVFMHVTYGYTGIAYFTYEDAQGPAMVDLEGKPRPLYDAVASLNHEIARIGRVIRFLTSTDVGILPGPGRSVPEGAVAWQAQMGGGDIATVDFGDGQPGENKDLLLGYFEDDDGSRYVMVTNLWHGPDASAEDRALTVRLTFADHVEAVQRLSRTTGTAESLQLHDGSVSLELPGGTGELLRIGAGTFPGLH